MIETIIILVGVICFLLMTIAIHSLRDKTISLENTVKKRDCVIDELVHELACVSGKLK